MQCGCVGDFAPVPTFDNGEAPHPATICQISIATREESCEGLEESDTYTIHVRRTKHGGLLHDRSGNTMADCRAGTREVGVGVLRTSQFEHSVTRQITPLKAVNHWSQL